MKKPILFFIVASLIISSCHNKESLKQPFSYAITNTQDVAMQKGSADTILPHFQLLGGNPEDINLSVSGLPGNVTAELSQVTGKPTFILQLIFKAAANATPGVYPIKIESTGSSAGPQSANIKLSVVDDCSPSFVDSFNVTEACSIDNYSYTVVVTATNTPYVIQMRNFGNYGYNTIIRVNLNCIDHTLLIPLQDVGGGFRVTGHGSFTDTSININYALSSDLNIEQDVCNDVFLRKP